MFCDFIIKYTDIFAEKVREASHNFQLVRLEELKTFLLKQKYPSYLIDDSIAKIKALKRSDLLKQNESTNKDNN